MTPQQSDAIIKLSLINKACIHLNAYPFCSSTMRSLEQKGLVRKLRNRYWTLTAKGKSKAME